MSTRTKSIEIKKCDRCGSEAEDHSDVETNGHKGWALVSGQHADSAGPLFTPAGSGYKVDLCPACTTELRNWMLRLPNLTPPGA